MKLLLYCSKKGPQLVKHNNGFNINNLNKCNWELKEYEEIEVNGKIVAECDFKFEKVYFMSNSRDLWWGTEKTDISKDSGLTPKEIAKYYNKLHGYIVRVKNINVFEEPKEINCYMKRTPKLVSDIICDSCTDFGSDCKTCPDYYEYYNLDRVPTRMTYCYSEKVGEEYIFMSVDSKRLRKLLNGEISVLLCKTVLKEKV